MNTRFTSFDQYLVALSDWLPDVIVANHLFEILDLYCAGESVEATAEAVALLVQINAPNTSVL